MSTVLEVQRAVLAPGFDIGKAGADGLIGKSTCNAILQSLANDPVIGGAVPTPTPRPSIDPLPADWLPRAQMQRIIVHWTAGTHEVEAADLLRGVDRPYRVYGRRRGCVDSGQDRPARGRRLCRARAAVREPVAADDGQRAYRRSAGLRHHRHQPR